MKIHDIEPGGVYMGLGRHIREVVKFSPDGNRVLYRTKTYVKQAYTGKVTVPIGTETWIALQSFAGWACEEVA